MDKKAALAKIWRETHRDYKGVIDGEKTIMVWIPSKGSCIVGLTDLTDEQIKDRVKEYQPN